MPRPFRRGRPDTRIELIESVISGTQEALVSGYAELAIAGRIPPGFSGDALIRLRLVPAASPQHPLHQLQRKVTLKDLRAHRQLVVRETGTDPRRAHIASKRRSAGRSATCRRLSSPRARATVMRGCRNTRSATNSRRALCAAAAARRRRTLRRALSRLRRSRRGGSGHAAPRGNHPRIDLRRVHQGASGLTGGNRRRGCRLK